MDSNTNPTRIELLRRKVEQVRTSADAMEAAAETLTVLRRELDDERNVRLRAHIDILTLLAVLSPLNLSGSDLRAVEKVRARWERGE